MKAMLLKSISDLNQNKAPLIPENVPEPVPADNEVLIRISACGKCEFCSRGEENICKEFKATGRDVNGGYAEYMTVS